MGERIGLPVFATAAMKTRMRGKNIKGNVRNVKEICVLIKSATHAERTV